MKTMYDLSIDSSDRKITIIQLYSHDAKTISVRNVNNLTSQNILRVLENILTARKIGWDSINSIHVHTGPGSFTGLRVGLAIAKSVGFLLGLPVNNQSPLSNISLRYDTSIFDD